MSFADAYQEYHETIWSNYNNRGQICCEPRKQNVNGSWEYDPIDGAPHTSRERLEKDLKGAKDALIVGSERSVAS